jgi:uncharacterized Fe-S cluster-containing MiaB family protein
LTISFASPLERQNVSNAHQNRLANKFPVDESRPYAVLVEDERSIAGSLEPVLTVFLTNRECPFSCTYCDLWKHTLNHTVSPGAMGREIQYAIDQHKEDLPRTIKLYNSGNFFDPKAIPPGDLPEIAKLLTPFERVIVENHPKLCGDQVLRFRDLLGDPQLEVAMGLEVWDDVLLAQYEKGMTTNDFLRATQFLLQEGIDTRAFILVPPPLVSRPREAMQLARLSCSTAWEVGVNACCLVPLRPDVLSSDALETTAPTTLALVENAMENAAAGRLAAFEESRLFVDLWDMPRIATCERCRVRRIARLETMNRSQEFDVEPILCDCDAAERKWIRET